MKNSTQNQQTCNSNTTWTINTNDFNFMDRLEYLKPNFADNMYNKNTIWITNEAKNVKDTK